MTSTDESTVGFRCHGELGPRWRRTISGRHRAGTYRNRSGPSQHIRERHPGPSPDGGFLSRLTRLGGRPDGGELKRSAGERATSRAREPAAVSATARSTAEDPAPITVTSLSANIARS